MATTDTIRGTLGGDARFFPRFTLWIGHAAGRFDALLERRRSRLALLELTDAELKDIGISRGDAYRDAHRPFFGPSGSGRAGE